MHQFIMYSIKSSWGLNTYFSGQTLASFLFVSVFPFFKVGLKASRIQTSTFVAEGNNVDHDTLPRLETLIEIVTVI